MTAIILRKNTFTGVVYRDDPTILAWDIANEPSNPGDDSGDILQVSNTAPQRMLTSLCWQGKPCLLQSERLQRTSSSTCTAVPETAHCCDQTLQLSALGRSVGRTVVLVEVDFTKLDLEPGIVVKMPLEILLMLLVLLHKSPAWTQEGLLTQ